jgi:dUTP pyrophosphatase
MKVKIKKLNDNAVLPHKAHPSDAGFDLVATSMSVDNMGNIVYGTGLAFEIPEGYVGLLFPRSSISRKDLSLANAVGVVDSHYRGEVTFKFKATWRAWQNDSIKYGLKCLRNTLDASHYMDVYELGDRIGQLIIMPYPEIEFEEVDELSSTDRGEGGFGSTGK